MCAFAVSGLSRDWLGRCQILFVELLLQKLLAGLLLFRELLEHRARLIHAGDVSAVQKPVKLSVRTVTCRANGTCCLTVFHTY